MNSYIVLFRNGHKIKLDVPDGQKLIDTLIGSMQKNPNSTNSYYSEPGIIICVTDISACYPMQMEVVE